MKILKLNLGDSPVAIRDTLQTICNKLFNKKCNKIYITSITPKDPDEHDIWFDMGNAVEPPVYDKPISFTPLEIDGTVYESYMSKSISVEGTIRLFTYRDFIVNAILNDKKREENFFVDCIIGTDWMMVSGLKFYDRVYTDHYKAAYYGYYDAATLYKQNDKYFPIPIGSLNSNIFTFNGKKYTVTALMGMYDERTTEGNGFTDIFAIDTGDGTINFDRITLTLRHEMKRTGRVIQYVKTLYASDFVTGSKVNIKQAIWPDETNGAIPKLFEILHDLNSQSEGEVGWDIKPYSDTAFFNMKRSYEEDTNNVKIDIPTSGQLVSVPVHSTITSKRKIRMMREQIKEDPIFVTSNGKSITIESISLRIDFSANRTYGVYRLCIALGKSLFNIATICINGNPESMITLNGVKESYAISDKETNINIWKEYINKYDELPIRIELL